MFNVIGGKRRPCDGRFLLLPLIQGLFQMLDAQAVSLFLSFKFGDTMVVRLFFLFQTAQAFFIVSPHLFQLPEDIIQRGIGQSITGKSQEAGRDPARNITPTSYAPFGSSFRPVIH
jgi:hypothetical protein